MTKTTYRRYATLLFAFFALICLLPQGAKAQSSSWLEQNLSNVKIDDLTDDQISSAIKQFQSAGHKVEEMGDVAAERGLPPEEVVKLKDRVAKLELRSVNLEEASNQKIEGERLISE